MNLNDLLLKMVSNNLLTIADANIALQDIKKDIISNYVELQYTPGPNHAIEIDVAPDILEKLFQRIRNQWIKLGETEPYMSVLSTEKFLMANIEANLTEFRSSGQLELNHLAKLAKKK